MGARLSHLRRTPRTRLATLGRVALVTAGIVGTLPPGADAQRSYERAEAERGWVGISFEVVGDRWGRANYVVITDVSHGSPAERAGLRAGDRVVAINDLDSPEELASLTERLRLRAGDQVAMQVVRDGRKRRFRLQAAPRPVDFEVGRTIELTIEADSMVETLFRAMDSLRVELVSERARPGTSFGRTPGASERRITVVSEGHEQAVRAPFEFFVFRGEGHDSLQSQMTDLNHTLRELEDRMRRRERELRATGGTRAAARLGEDAEYRRLSAALNEASARSDALEAAMAAEARRTAEQELRVRRAPTTAARVAAGIGRSEPTEFRPLTPYLLGRNRVAGAEVVDLRPELAQYFEVTQGVLVVDVAPGTPAAIAGIQPGDVITRLDQVPVRTVEDLRFGVSVAEDALPIALVRRGSSLQVLLRR